MLNIKCILMLATLASNAVLGQQLINSPSVVGNNIQQQRLSPVVDLRYGRLRGTTEIVGEKTIFSFKGIPYAEPPIGKRRFRPTAPHKGWTGTTKFATKFESICPQPSGSRRVRSNMKEDCLFLNIWTTYLPSSAISSGSRRLRPVVIFLEGQLFTLSNPIDFPAKDFVSDQDVVFVSVNYRVNAFGFLSWSDSTMPGNLGLLDQYLAILWVFNNIGNVFWFVFFKKYLISTTF